MGSKKGYALEKQHLFEDIFNLPNEDMQGILESKKKDIKSTLSKNSVIQNKVLIFPPRAFCGIRINTIDRSEELIICNTHAPGGRYDDCYFMDEQLCKAKRSLISTLIKESTDYFGQRPDIIAGDLNSNYEEEEGKRDDISKAIFGSVSGNYNPALEWDEFSADPTLNINGMTKKQLWNEYYFGAH